MTSIAAVCSFVAFGPAVTCLFAKTKQKGLDYLLPVNYMALIPLIGERSH